MTEINLPNKSKTKADPILSGDWYDNDKAIKDVVEGELTNANLSGSAGVTDANLASPNNPAYREIYRASGHAGLDLAAGTYMLGTKNDFDPNMIKSGTETSSSIVPFPLFYFDNADYEVSGKTLKLRLRAQVAANATKPTIKFTVGLYPITVAGTADLLTVTLGTVVSGSTVEFNEPAASTVTQKEATDFTVPADGAYALGVVTSGTLTNNSYAFVSAQLQVRNV